MENFMPFPSSRSLPDFANFAHFSRPGTTTAWLPSPRTSAACCAAAGSPVAPGW